jgi:hypothetical protein
LLAGLRAVCCRLLTMRDCWQAILSCQRAG